MGTISLCVVGLLIYEFLPVPACMHMVAPQTRTAIGRDPHLQTFAYGGRISNFPYAHKHIIQMVSDRKISVYVMVSVKPPYAYGDASSNNHNMCTGMFLLRAPFPRCALLSFRDSGASRPTGQNQLPYAYGETPYAYGQGRVKIRLWGVPLRIMKSCPYGD